MSDTADNATKTIGILGGGQLGRMSAIAAEKLGIESIIFCPEADGPASQVATKTINASYDDQDALKAFASQVDVVSYEFENIPVDTIETLKEWKPVYPDVTLINVSQHRGSEKSFLNQSGLSTANWHVVHSAEEIIPACNDMGCSEFIAKTTRFGYDGKGQTRLSLEKLTDETSRDKWSSLNTDEVIIEQAIDFEYEISVVVARDQFGDSVFYGPSLNTHKDGILHHSLYPAPISEDIKKRSIDLTKTLAEAIDLRGVLAIEYFVTKDGDILANEIAPRTHNSGHWTMDACESSQFDNHIRTVCGLPVADPAPHSSVLMLNLLGSAITEREKWESMDNVVFHDYGKADIKEGRKMGHVNILQPSNDFLSSLA